MYLILRTPTFSFSSRNILIVKGLHSITVDSSPSASLSQQMLLQSELHSTDMNQARWSKAQGVCRDVRKISEAGKSSLRVWGHKTRASPIFATSKAQIWNKTENRPPGRCAHLQQQHFTYVAFHLSSWNKSSHQSETRAGWDVQDQISQPSTQN